MILYTFTVLSVALTLVSPVFTTIAVAVTAFSLFIEIVDLFK